MRSPLFVPRGDPEALAAAARSGAGALVLDLCAAGAAPPFGSIARLARSGPARPLLVVRIGALTGGLADADLDAAMVGAPDAVLLPGAVGARDLQHLAAKLAVREAERGLPPGRTRIVAAAADTAAGVLALGSLPAATPRLLALAWDPSALAAALGVASDAPPLLTARDLLLVAAAAAGVPAFDAGFPSDDLAAACRAARRAGFAGRLARGPEEVAAIAAAFAPQGRSTAGCACPRVDYAGSRP